MKKIGVCTVATGLIALTGCVGPMGPVGGIGGSLYTDVSGPVAVTSNAAGNKMGQATSTGIVGFALGDSSIKAAAANGGISSISHVDYHITSILGIWAKTTTTVYGN
jgi:TRL-like protein family